MDTKICVISKMYDTRTQIYILYNYELYKLTIKIYVHNYVSDFFFSRKKLFMVGSKEFFYYFIIIIKIYTISLNF